MRFGLITLFPEIFQALQYGITGRAQDKQLIELHYWNPRDYSEDRHRRVDDRPYGGGPGMVMMAEPLLKCIALARAQLPKAKVVYLSPQGRVLQQAHVDKLSETEELILLAGRYEGIDERVILNAIDEEWSIGDYILTGGEVAGLVMIDAITRLLPGALGDEESANQDSFTQGILDHPHYTRPEISAGLTIPEVLKSGDHAAIARWRRQQALGKTWAKRPDLLVNYPLTAADEVLLTEFIADFKRADGSKAQ